MYYPRNYKQTDYDYGEYTRKSSEDEGRQVQSIPKQQRINYEDAQRVGVKFVCRYSESKSAYKHSIRAEFDQMVRDTEQGKINAWWCYDTTRLCRNALEAGIIVTLLKEGKLHHIHTKWRTYFNTARDRKNLMDEFTDSDFDSGKKSESVKDGLTERYRKGYPNGVAPLGFRNDQSREKGDRGWWVEEHKFKLVRQLLKEFLTGKYSISIITEYANKTLGLRTPKRKRNGGRMLTRSYVHKHILLNPVYAGFFYAKSETGERVRYELNKKLPKAISESEHNKIKMILGRKNISKRQKHDPTYAGFISSPEDNFIGADYTVNLRCDCKHKFAPRNKEVCPKCGIKISKMKEPRYYTYTHYYNVRRRKSKEVKAKTIREKTIDEFLCDYFNENLKLSKALTDWTLRHLHQLNDQEIEENKAMVKSQKSVEVDFEKRKKRLRDLLVREVITEEEFKQDLAETELKQRQMVQQPKVVDWISCAEEMVTITQEFGNVMRNGSSTEKRTVLSKLGSNLVWNEEKLSIINTKPVQALVDALNKAKNKNPMFEPVNIVDITDRNEVFADVRPVLLRPLFLARTSIMAGESVVLS